MWQSGKPQSLEACVMDLLASFLCSLIISDFKRFYLKTMYKVCALAEVAQPFHVSLSRRKQVCFRLSKGVSQWLCRLKGASAPAPCSEITWCLWECPGPPGKLGDVRDRRPTPCGRPQLRRQEHWHPTPDQNRVSSAPATSESLRGSF